MATTNLVVDYLVIGIGSLVWVFPALVALSGTQWLCSAVKAGAAGAVLVAGVVYVLGICISRIADDVTGRWNDRMRDEVFGTSGGQPYHWQLNFVVAKSESGSEYLSYRRSIVRISRACALHFGLGALAWAIAGCLPARGVSLLPGAVCAAACGGACWVMTKAWKVVLKGYFHSVKDIYEHLSQTE